MIQDIYNEFRKSMEIEDIDDYKIDSGKVTLFDNKTKALVYCDGRYPLVGFETKDVDQPGEILWGEMSINRINKEEVESINKGEKFNFKAGEGFFIEANCVCLISLDEPWKG